MAEALPKSEYILGYDAAEHERLDRQAAMWEDATREALAAVGVKPGWRCLDAACGTGSVTRILGELVGPSGAVHAADLDEIYGSAAIARLNSGGRPIHSFEKLDLVDGDDPKGAPFDIVFTRLLICHMTDPVRMLKRLWSWVKPGGVLLVQDYDMGVMHRAPITEPTMRAYDLIRAVFSKSGKDPRAGASMPHYFIEAGIGYPDGTLVRGKLAPVAEVVGMHTAALSSMTPGLVKLGAATADEMTALIADIGRLSTDPAATARIPDMIASWKKRAD